MLCAHGIKLTGRKEGAKSIWRHPDGTICTPNREKTFERCGRLCKAIRDFRRLQLAKRVQ